MTELQALILGLLQGITEFLPISSSGHLVLLEHFMQLDINAGTLQYFDVILHGGTLLAIIIYFHKTWFRILLNPFKKEPDGGSALLPMLAVATIPVGLAGIFGADFIEKYTRTAGFVSAGFLLTAFLLLSAYSFGHKNKSSVVRWHQILIMSLGQAIAILPGFSRSGWTLSTGTLAGLKTKKATEIAFLMGAPALGGAALYAVLNGLNELLAIGLSILFLGFLSALFSSLVVMHFFLVLLKKYGLWIWSVYLIFAALCLIVLN